MPRWEIWVNVFIHYAIANVVNSLATLEFESHQMGMQGASKASGIAYAAWDKLVGNVMILEAHVMDFWVEKDPEYEMARGAFHQAIHGEDLGVLGAMEMATRFYHAILQLLNRRGLLRFRPPRSLAAPTHDE